MPVPGFRKSPGEGEQPSAGQLPRQGTGSVSATHCEFVFSHFCVEGIGEQEAFSLGLKDALCLVFLVPL